MIDKHGAPGPIEPIIWVEAPHPRLHGKRFKLELQEPSNQGWRDAEPVWIGLYAEAGEEFDSGEGL